MKKQSSEVLANIKSKNLKVDKEKIAENLEKMQKTEEFVKVVNKVEDFYSKTKENGGLLPKFLSVLEKNDKELAGVLIDIIKQEEPALWEKDSYMQQVILTGILTKAVLIASLYDKNNTFISYIDELLALLRYDYVPVIWLNIALEDYIPKFIEIRYLIVQYYNEYYKQQ